MLLLCTFLWEEISPRGLLCPLPCRTQGKLSCPPITGVAAALGKTAAGLQRVGNTSEQVRDMGANPKGAFTDGDWPKAGK